MRGPDGPRSLPAAVEDHGDHLEVPPRRPVVAWGTAIVLLLAGLTLGGVGPGDLADQPLVRVGLAFALVVAAGLVAGTGTMRSWFDASVAGRRSVFGRRSVPWPEIVAVRLEERIEHTPVGGFAHRLPGGVTISAGPGGGRRGPGGRRHGPRVWRPTRVVDVRLTAEDGRRIAVPLEDADVSEAEALVEELTVRGWLAEDVEREVVSG